MIIEKIVIKSFGTLTDMTLEFSEKVNVIEGRNEAGKTTIAAFIKYMLYGFDGDESGVEVSERKKRINWNTGVAQGSMYVKAKGKRYLITRSTVPTDNSPRPTYKEEASIIDLETGTPAFGKLSAGEVFFGVDRELFDNTAFVGQIGDSAIDEDSVKKSIENILFSGSERINNQRAAAKISDKMEALMHRSGAGGAIYDLMIKENELEAKLEESDADNKEILVKEAELHRIRERRTAAEERQEKLREADSCYRNVMLIQTFDQLHALEEECEQKAEAYNSFIAENTVLGFVPTEQYLTDLSVSRRSVNDSYHALGDAQDAYTEQKNAVGITREIEGAIEHSDELGGEASVLMKAGSLFGKFARSLTFGIISGLALIAALVFTVVAITGALGTLYTVLGAVAGGVLAVSLITFTVLAVKNHGRLRALAASFGTEAYKDLKGKIAIIAEARAKRDAMIAAIEAARSAATRARDRYEEAKAELTGLILKWGGEPPISGLGEFLDGLEERVRAFLEKKNALLDEKTNIEITVREIRRTLADKSEIDVRAQVSPLKRKALAGINHDEIINGIADTRAQISEQDRLAFEVENELMLLKSRAGDPGELYSRIAAISTRREELQARHKAYYVALKAIENASDNLRAEISPRLGEYATRMMEIMTDNKYTSFDITDGLKVSFTTPGGEQRSVDFLSGGTRDLTYFAVRAALIDMLYTEKPPVCFDESFAHQDNVRARSMMRAIKQLGDEGCQSFVFTCRSREGVLAEEIIPGASIFKLSVVAE